MKPFKSIIPILAVLFLFHSVAFGLDNEIARKTLRGLEGVYVLISLDEKIPQVGLLESQSRTDVEEKLRTAGIKVLLDKPGVPWMRVHLYSLNNNQDIVYMVHLDLIQDAHLIKNYKLTRLTRVITWSTGYLRRTYRIEDVRSDIKDLTDQFINAYLSVNPKK